MALAALLAACGSLRPEEVRPPFRLHGEKFADPSNPEYHGNYLRTETNYAFAPCRTCHGADLRGGEVGVSCETCHAGGPTACATCHALPPRNGAHAAHAARVECSSCHRVPDRYDAPGHLDGDRVAEVVFGALALARGAHPTYADRRCSGTYCHGAASPRWDDGPAAVACGTCHGVPPPGHYGERCHSCHGQVVDADRRIVNAALHVDGTVQAVDLSRGCASCHGPPQDLGGAHAAHLAGGRVGRAVACTECHRVPSAISDTGHNDGRVDVRLGPLSRTGGATPSWDGTRCSGAYCHGARLRGGTGTAPAWRGGAAEVACGTCHGVPYPDHHGERCSDCHGSVVDRAGRIVRPDLHVNGRVDFGGAP